MKTLLVYASQSGTTAKAAALLAQRLGGCDLVDITKKKAAAHCDAAGYDAVIAGSYVRMGALAPTVVAFLDRNRAALQDRRCGLFLLGYFEEYSAQYLDKLFPRWLAGRATRGWFGGELDLARLRGFERMTMKMVERQNGALPACRLDVAAIDDFARRFRAGEK